MNRCVGIVRNGQRTGRRCHLLAVDGLDVCEYHTPPCDVISEGRTGLPTRCLKPTVPFTDKCFLHTERTYAAKGTTARR